MLLIMHPNFSGVWMAVSASSLLKRKLFFVLTLASFIFAAFVFFWRLGENHLIEFDEALYASVAKNIVRDGDFLTLKLRGGVPWFDKPPLYFWLSALSIRLLGFSSLAPRIPSALFGIGTVILTFLLGRNLFGRKVGAVATVVLASTTGYVYYGRLGMLDVPLSFFLTGAVLFFWLGRRNSKYYLLTGLFLGLGLLVKNLIVLLCLPSFLALIAVEWRDRRRLYFNRHFWAGVFIMLAVALPWHLYMLRSFGKPFAEVYLAYHFFQRIGSVVEGEAAPPLWYFKVVQTQFRIWYLVLYPALIWVIAKVARGDRASALIFFNAATIFTAFSLASSKLIWFVIPIYPFLAVIVSVFLCGFLEILFSVRGETLVLFLILLIGVFYSLRRLDKVITPDFSKDLVTGIEAANEIDDRRPLVVSSEDYYTSYYYNQEGLVVSISYQDLATVLRSFRGYFFLVPQKILSGSAYQRYAKEIGNYGSYSLLQSF